MDKDIVERLDQEAGMPSTYPEDSALMFEAAQIIKSQRTLIWQAITTLENDKYGSRAENALSVLRRGIDE